MINDIFAFVWPVGSWKVVFVRGWNRAVLEDRYTYKRKEVTYKFGIKEQVK